MRVHCMAERADIAKPEGEASPLGRRANRRTSQEPKRNRRGLSHAAFGP